MWRPWLLVLWFGFLNIDGSTGEDLPVDLCFAIDRYIPLENWKTQLDFVKKLAEHLQIDETQTRIGVVSYASLSHLDIKLSDHSQSASLTEAISNLVNPGTQRAVDQALYRLRANCFVEGGRDGVPNIAILVVAGTTSSALAIYEADQLKPTARIITIGVGQDVDKDLMIQIASSAASNFYYPTFAALLDDTAVILHNVSPTQVLPMLNSAPMIDSPVIDGSSFTLPCQLDYDPKARAAFRVVFYLDDVDTGVTPTVLTSPSKVASFSGDRLQGHLGKSLSCKVTGFWTNQTTKVGPPAYSNKYFVGIKLSKNVITISEVDQSAQGGSPSVEVIHINPTIPILCPVGTDSCQLDLDITASPAVKVGQTDVPGMEPQHVCTYTLTQDDVINSKDTQTGRALSITPTTMTIGKTPPVTTSTVTFSIRQAGGNSPALFTNYKMGGVRVTCQGNQKPGYCKATGDPHITTFDLFYYTVRPVKVYWLMRNPAVNVYIQVATRAWTNGVAVICGIAMRWGTHMTTGSGTTGLGETFFVDACGTNVVCAKCQNQMSPGSSLSINGVIYTLQVPDTTKVIAKLRTYGPLRFHDVEVFVPASYFMQTSGLCGNFNGINTDEYMGGTLSMHQTLNEVPAALNYFNCPITQTINGRKRRQADEEEHVHYCTCTAASKASKTCKIGPDPKGTMVKPPIFLGGRQPAAKANGAVLHKYTPPMTDPVQVEFNEPAWGDLGVTEVEADTACKTALQGAKFYASCTGTPSYTNQEDMDAFLFGCKRDIKFTGNLNWTHSHVDGFRGTCENKIYSSLTIDVNNFDDPMKDANYKTIVGTFLSKTCPQDCSGHGTCNNNGICDCEQGYVGADCSIDKTIPPVPLRYLDPEECDVAEEPCTSITIRADKLSNSPQLSCKVTVKLSDGEEMTKTFPGQLISSESVRCPLYDLLEIGSASKPVSYTYTIVLSNDGVNYGSLLTSTDTRRVFYSVWTSTATSVGFSNVLMLAFTGLVLIINKM